MTENNVALYFLKALKKEGINHVFLVPGYNVDSFVKNYARAGITAIVAAHEGGAAYMADGYARARQSLGVCMGLSGPGITNMVTAIAAAYTDRSPVLVVTSVLPPEWNGDGPFQDSSPTGVDDCEIMRPITVLAQRIPAVYQSRPEDEKKSKDGYDYKIHPAYDKVGDYLQKAIRAMLCIENQPAYLSLPLEIIEEPYDRQYTPVNIQEPIRAIDTHAVKSVPAILKKATRIVILAGNGCVWSQASKTLEEFAEKYSIPVVTTLRAKGLISEKHKMSFGFFGISGTLQANKLVMGNENDPQILGAEVLIVLGGTLNENNTFAWDPRFAQSKALIRVDINPTNVTGKNYDETFVMGDIKTFLEWLDVNHDEFNQKLLDSKSEREKWLNSIRETPIHDGKPEQTRESKAIPIHPARLVVELRKVAPRNTVLVVDSGAHSYHVPHHWESYAPNEFFILTNTGPMGYGIAFAIGAKQARPHQPCVAVVGDGSLLMHGMEIHTAVRFNVPIIIVVINNEALGNVYLRSIDPSDRWPDPARKLATITPKLKCVDFAKSLGADGTAVTDPSQLAAAFEKAFAFIESKQLPFLVEVSCCRNCQVPNSPYSYEQVPDPDLSGSDPSSPEALSGSSRSSGAERAISVFQRSRFFRNRYQ